jgi:hypothetical protein
MPLPSPSELKKILISEGFEVYRTLGTRIMMADRVRDNLIMDSGVSAVVADEGLSVRVVVRAQSHDFPGESADELYGRAVRLAAGAVEQGYTEIARQVVPIHDPGDRSRTLDTWYEVTFERPIADVGDLAREVRFAMGLDKTATPGTRA